MVVSNHEILQEGRMEFERYFKKKLGRKGFWDVKFQWGENEPDKKESLLGVEMNAHIILLVPNKEVAEFATPTRDKKCRTQVLQKKEKALIEKMRLP